MAFSNTEHTPAPPGHINPTSTSYAELTSNKSPVISIPEIEAPDDALPPLPPLRYAPGSSEPQQQLGGMREKVEYCPRPLSFVSGYGSMASSSAGNGSSHQQRYTCNTMDDRDEDYANSFSTDRSGESLRQEFGVHHALFHFQSPADIHAESMKKRLGLVRNVTMPLPRSLLSASANDLLFERPSGENQYLPTFSVPVQLPAITSRALGSPARYPKQQKKHESVDKVNAHKVEKQYKCSTCGTRFGNKNEAKRHQTSLHHRRRSWSCSALSGYNCAFYDSTDRPGQTDTCCYCGDEFPRSGHGPSTATLSDRSAPRHVTDHDWDERIRHLERVHGFGECNLFKKFYRADHFRQHLKHSHAGKSGKWSKILENACMLDNDPTHE